MSRPRSMTYLIWRVCERMGISQFDWINLKYEQQLTYLSYERLRQQEEQQLGKSSFPLIEKGF